MGAHVLGSHSGKGGSARCIGCATRIATSAFTTRPGIDDVRVAVCSICSTTNLLLAVPHTDVIRVPGGRWRASCDCGAVAGVPGQGEGWTWVLEHDCARPTAY